jgi:DNA repair protein RadC
METKTYKTYKTNIKTYTLQKHKTDIPMAQIKSSAHSEKYLRQFYETDIEIFESCFILALNRANNTEGYVKISQGGTAGTVVDIKIICKYAVDMLASSIILCHNHPSGAIIPSQQDLDLTYKIKNALLMMDITLMDHIILAKEKYFSFADEGLLP